jgi:hypothetical protein
MPQKTSATIAAPKMPSDHPDRRLECEFVLEAGFQLLSLEAEAVGWSGEEVAHALMSLARARIRTIGEKEMAEYQIRSARSRH